MSPLFLFLDLSHQLLRLIILTRHDVRHTEVRQHDGLHVEQLSQSMTSSSSPAHVIQVLLHDGLIISNGILESTLLHEEDVGHVQLPHVVIVTKVHRGAEELANLCVVLHVPVDLRLAHQNRNVSLEGFVKLFHGRLRLDFVAVVVGVLNLFRQFAKDLDVLLGQLVEFTVSLLRRRLLHDEGIQECVETLVRVRGRSR